MAGKAAMLVIVALCAVSGALGRDMAQAPAGQSKPIADLLFILSADMATFTDANILVLTNASSTAQYYGKGARAGIIPTIGFANSSAGAKYVSSNGQWLGNPTATLSGVDQNGTSHSVLLTLSAPKAEPADKSVTFHVSVITDGETAIKTRQGVANGVTEDSATEPGMLLTNVPAGTKLSDVALFVDSNNMALGPQAHTKWWHGGWGGGWGRGWGGGWGGGYGGGCGWGGCGCGWGGCGWYGK